MKVKGFKFTDEFWEDFDIHSESVINQLMIKLSAIQRTGKIPKSMNAHRADFFKDLWIGYVNPSDRVLFKVDSNATMIVLRFVNHSKMDALLNPLVDSELDSYYNYN